MVQLRDRRTEKKIRPNEGRTEKESFPTRDGHADRPPPSYNVVSTIPKIPLSTLRLVNQIQYAANERSPIVNFCTFRYCQRVVRFMRKSLPSRPREKSLSGALFPTTRPEELHWSWSWSWTGMYCIVRRGCGHERDYTVLYALVVVLVMNGIVPYCILWLWPWSWTGFYCIVCCGHGCGHGRDCTVLNVVVAVMFMPLCNLSLSQCMKVNFKCSGRM